MSAQNVVEGFDVEDSLPTLSPLIAQPLVETCLQVPSWYWFAERPNPAIARRGFAGLLPREIVERRSKGSPDSFIIEIHDAHRPLIRSMLLDGVLASRGLLDTAVLARVLDHRGPVTGHGFFRIMRLVDVEAWVRTIQLDSEQIRDGGRPDASSGCQAFSSNRSYRRWTGGRP